MSDERLLAFTRSLSDSVRGGLPPAATLRELGLESSADAVEKGMTMHEALAASGRFPPVLIALIRAGEESGKLDEFLDRFSAALDTRIDFRRRLDRALVYPAFTALLAGALFLAFSTKAAPMLLQPILDAGMAVPAGALRVIALGGWILANWPLLLGASAGVIVVLWSAAASTPGRRALSLAGHWLPGARFASEEARHYQFEATMELLLGAGLRPKQIMEIMTEYFRDDPVLRRRLERGAVLLAAGKSFTESLGACLPADDRPRVAVAETAGRLDETFGKLAVSHRERHLHRLKLAASAVQLAGAVALAPLCFGLILWVLWPTLSMLRSAGAGLTGLGAPPAVEETPPLTMEKTLSPQAAATSRFNEANAKKVLGYMQEHGAGEGKPAPRPKLKPRAAMQKPQFKKIESSSFKSTLD